jgi:heat shock protein HslJ
VPNPESYTLTFNPDSTFSFQADCNSGSGTYMVDGNGLRLDLGAVSEADCGPDSLSNQYLALLSTVESFEFEGDRLVLRLVGDAGYFVFVP